jgi:hypothetical protein
VRRPSADVVIAILLAAAAAAVWLPFAWHANFLYDDLAIVSRAVHFPPPFHSDRPLDNLFLLEGLAGNRPALYYGITELLGAGAVAALYLCLRRLELSRPAAIVAAATFAVAPLSDSIHLWWAASGIVLSIALATTAIAVGSRWVAEGPRRLGSLILSELLLAGAVLSFEAGALLILLPVALIPLSRNRRRTILKLCADIAVALVSGYAVVSIAVAGHGAPGASIFDTGRIFALVRAGINTYGGYVLQMVGWRGAVAGAALVVATGVLLLVRRHGRTDGEPLVRGITSLAMLIALLPLNWMPLVLVNDWYQPGRLGMGNRVNAIGDVVFCAALGLAASLAGRIVARVSRGDVLGAMVTAGIAGAIVVTSASRSLGDAPVYTKAGQRAGDIQALVRELVPEPRHGDHFLLTHYNTYQGEIWVPVLAAWWDVTGAMRLMYNDDTLRGDPLGALVCSPTQLQAGDSAATYGHLHVIDVDGRRLVPVVDKATCETLLPRLATRPYPAL